MDQNQWTTNTDIPDEIENMYLNFVVDNDSYGIEIQYVLQIVGMQKINEMPEMTHAMQGFINLRGTIIPVISMRALFGKAEQEYTDRTCIIVVMINEKQVGLIVDAIQETITIEPEDISDPPNKDMTTDTRYIKGIGRLGNNRVVILLYAPKLLEQNF